MRIGATNGANVEKKRVLDGSRNEVRKTMFLMHIPMLKENSDTNKFQTISVLFF